MSQSNSVPEHKLRHDRTVSAISQLGRSAPAIGSARSSRTSSHTDCSGEALPHSGAPLRLTAQIVISPLSWWRVPAADQFFAAEHLQISSTLDEIATARKGSGLEPALCGDCDAAIGLVLAAMPIWTIGVRIDIATAVLRCALHGDLSPVLVLAHVIDRADIDRGHAPSLYASWFEYYLRHSSATGGLTRTEKSVLKTLQECESTWSADDGEHA